MQLSRLLLHGRRSKVIVGACVFPLVADSGHGTKMPKTLVPSKGITLTPWIEPTMRSRASLGGVCIALQRSRMHIATDLIGLESA